MIVPEIILEKIEEEEEKHNRKPEYPEACIRCCKPKPEIVDEGHEINNIICIRCWRPTKRVIRPPLVRETPPIGI